MSKSTTVSIALDEDAYLVFQNASEIVSKAGIRVPTGHVQTMINGEISRLSARKIAQRFLSLSWNRSAHSPAKILMRRKMTPFQPFLHRKQNEDFF